MHRFIATIVATSDELHEDDVDVPGVYGIMLGDAPGGYPERPRMEPDPGDDPLVEAAKDVLHDHVGIRVLDDFDISFERQADDADLTGRDDIHWL